MEDNRIFVYNAIMVAHHKLKPWYTLIYFDCPQYLADNIFDKHGIRPWMGKEASTSDGKYIAISCRIRRKNLGKFFLCMDELQRKMIICGYTDYEEFCKIINESLENDEGLFEYD